MPVDNTKAAAAPGASDRPTTTDEIGLIDLIQVVADNLRLLIVVPLIVGLIALAVSFTMTPMFTATSTFLPPQQQSNAMGLLQSLGNLSSLAGASGIKNPSDQYIGFLKSSSVELAVIRRFKLQERYAVEVEQRAREALKGKVRISAGKDGLINIQFEDRDPEFAADVANGYIEELGQLLNRLAVTEAQQRRIFFEKQLSASKDALIVAEQSLAASGVSAASLNANPGLALEGPARLRAQVTAQEVKLASMRSYLTTSAPEFRQAQTELTALRSQLVKAEQERPAGKPGSDDYIAKYREFKYQETLFELFAKQYELARVDESREGSTVQTVDRASAPELKSSPKRGLIAIGGTVLSGVLLLIFVFIRFGIQRAISDHESRSQVSRVSASIRRAVGLK